MRSPQNLVKLIKYNSKEYQQAYQLRYRLFYAEHDLPWNQVFNPIKRHCCHLAIINSGHVSAYA